MKSKSYSFRLQLLMSFGSICFVFCGAIVVALYIHSRTKLHNELIDLLRDTESHYGQLTLNESNFLLFCESDEDFFKSGNSPFLKKRELIHQRIKDDLQAISNHGLNDKTNKSTDSIAYLLDEQSENYLRIVNLIKLRGFKDYGLEGRMRLLVHELENTPKAAISKIDILMLRRHEKDYLLRKTEHYQKAHQELVRRIINNLKTDERNRNYDIALLSEYSSEFQKLCRVNKELGDFEYQGALYQYKLNSNHIYTSLELLVQEAEARQRHNQSILQIVSYSVMVLAVLLGLVFSLLFAKRRSKPIKELLTKVEKIPLLGTDALNEDTLKGSSELMDLHTAFKRVFNQLKDQLIITRESRVKLEAQNTELQQVNRELDQFVYSISHDLRAPLTSVMGLVELSKYETEHEKLNVYHDMMERSLKKLDRFIHDILDFSRNSRLELEYERIDFHKIVNDIFEGLEFSHSTTNVRRTIEVDLGSAVYSDRRRLTVVLNNLISNSVKYADLSKEQPYVAVHVSGDQNSFQLSVSDNGQGIADKFKESVFKMFFRASQNAKGSGLGLYIVKETVQMLSGKISLDSIVDLGTTVKIEVPNSVSKTKKTHHQEVQLA